MQNEARMFHLESGERVDSPRDLDHRSREECDQCGNVGDGWVYHAAGATGRVCPVLFICDSCTNGNRMK